LLETRRNMIYPVPFLVLLLGLLCDLGESFKRPNRHNVVKMGASAVKVSKKSLSLAEMVSAGGQPLCTYLIKGMMSL